MLILVNTLSKTYAADDLSRRHFRCIFADSLIVAFDSIVTFYSRENNIVSMQFIILFKQGLYMLLLLLYNMLATDLRFLSHVFAHYWPHLQGYLTCSSLHVKLSSADNL